MLTYNLNAKNKYYSLYAAIRGDILCGKLKKGEKLPSKRGLAQNLCVSVITVQTAYEQLLAEGYIISKERSGYFVAEVEPQAEAKAAAPAEVLPCKKQFKLDLVTGSPPPELFPFSVWAKLMRRVLADCGEHLLERVPCDGDYGLKKAVAAYLYRARGVEVNPRYVIIGAGAEYLYGVLVQLLGRDKVFAVENPGYSRISASYALNGAKCAYIPVTDNGMDFSALQKSGACVAHISPSHQFPTGAVTSVAARTRLINWARDCGGYLVEDDYDSEFRLQGKPLQCALSLGRDRVIYMNTFSKSLAPSMRMGYAVLPPELYTKYLKLFSSSANAVPLFEQKTLAAMLDGGFFERHLNRLKNVYRQVRAELLARVRVFAPEVNDTGSGLHFLAKINDAPDDGYIKLKAEERGINIRCVSDYLLSPLNGYEKLAVINFSGLTVQKIKSAFPV